MPKVNIPIINNQKQCSKCEEWKDLYLFRKHIQHQSGHRSQCRVCETISHKPSTKRYPAKKCKEQVVKHYGGKCYCCDENNIGFLSIEHLDDNGKEHGNGKNRYKGEVLYRFLIKNNYPARITIACFNCNIGRQNNNGVCPHNITP
jgi:hypothetical protein